MLGLQIKITTLRNNNTAGIESWTNFNAIAFSTKSFCLSCKPTPDSTVVKGQWKETWKYITNSGIYLNTLYHHYFCGYILKFLPQSLATQGVWSWIHAESHVLATQEGDGFLPEKKENHLEVFCFLSYVHYAIILTAPLIRK